MEVRIKVPANIIYELDNTGGIKAKNIMPVLFSRPEASRKMESVMDSIWNLLWNGREVKEAYYDMLTNEVLLKISDQEWHRCPKCNLGYEGYPALSRKDNKTEICPECGQKEAMQEWINSQMVQKLKKDYPEGTRIELIKMGDDINGIDEGTKGTVTHVDDIGTIHCEFDNGRSLGMVPGVDIFRKVMEDEEV